MGRVYAVSKKAFRFSGVLEEAKVSAYDEIATCRMAGIWSNRASSIRIIKKNALPRLFK